MLRWTGPLLLVAVLGGCSYFRSAPPSFDVFFASRSAALDEPARSTVAEAARTANAHVSSTVTLSGFTDNRTGQAAADLQLARERVGAVADALAARGVAEARLRKLPYGPDPQAEGGVASRRVEIVIGH